MIELHIQLFVYGDAVASGRRTNLYGILLIDERSK